MNKYILRSIFIFTSIFFGFVVHAEMTINEVMYDVDGTDTDREWVEVYNSGPSAVDISTWKFTEANTNHSLVPFDGGSTISSGGYAVIASNPTKFKIDWPNYTGILFDSSFSLNNDPGEELSLKDSSLVVHDTVTYDTSVGAGGDGNTLNRSGSVFVVGSATPGGVNNTNQTTNTNSNTNSNSSESTPIGGGGSSTSSITVVKKKEVAIPRITTDIITKTSVLAGIPLVFEAKTTGYGGEPLSKGKFYWNFGDGSSKETAEYQKVEYIYDTPGEYVVSLEYTNNPYLYEPDATDRIIVTVTTPAVIISAITDDGSVEIVNTSANEIDISHWMLQSGDKSFSFPRNTILLSNKKIIFSSKVTNFSITSREARLILPTGSTIALYPQIKNTSQVVHTKIRTESNVSVSEPLSNTAVEKDYIPIEANVLSAINSLPSEHSSSIVWSVIGLVALISIAGLGSFFYIRKTRQTKSLSDEFELVE
jgi:Lamin Tail Domain/PKD domain